MKDTNSSKDGQPSSKANSKVKSLVQAQHPELRVRIGAKKPTVIAPGELAPDDWDALGKQYEQVEGQVVLEVVSLHAWPDDGRYSLLYMVKGLGAACRLQIGKRIYKDPFDAVLAAMKGPQSMEAHRQSFHAAIEAAGLFYGDMPDAAAKRINDRLAEVGGAKKNFPSLVKQIGEIAKGTKANMQLDAYAAAEAFLAHRVKVAAADDGQPVLRYYQADFYDWTGKSWSRQEDKNFDAQVMAFLQTLEIPNVTARFARDVVAHLTGMANLKCWTEPMPFLVVSENPLKIERPHLIVFRNGVINLDDLIAGKAAKIKPVNSFYFNETVLPYNYDPKAKCPLWLETLKGILPKNGKGDCRQLVLQEFFGYTLLSDCHLNKLLVLHGDGGNGRSTITEPWEFMLGSENVSDVPLEALGTEYRLWSLKGKLANFSGELQYMNKLHEGLVKRIVSGEVIDANRKHKDPAKFRPTAKLIVNTNDMPTIVDPTEAMWDRLIPIPFEVRIRDTVKDDKQRGTKLKNELGGIFNWAVKGLKRLLKQGHFTPCAKCAAFLHQHRTTSDTVRLFVSKCCQKDPGCVAYSVDLYQLYRFYCDATGRKPVADSEFGERLKRLHWTKQRETIGTRRLFYPDTGLSSTGLAYCVQAVNKKVCAKVISRDLPRGEDD